jgi:transposase
MNKANRYSPEVRERAVRMVVEHESDYSSQWQTICSIADKIGCSPDSLKAWLRRTQIDAGKAATKLKFEDGKRVEE